MGEAAEIQQYDWRDVQNGYMVDCSKVTSPITATISDLIGGLDNDFIYLFIFMYGQILLWFNPSEIIFLDKIFIFCNVLKYMAMKVLQLPLGSPRSAISFEYMEPLNFQHTCLFHHICVS